MARGLSRRSLIIGAIGLSAAACASDDDGPARTGSSGTTASTPTIAAGADRVALPGPPFTLGVASGEPVTTGVVLWSRLAPDPTAADGGMAGLGSVAVGWEVATDDRFAEIVAAGETDAEPDHVHCLHVDVEGLTPATAYFYRFSTGGFTSPVGRTSTLPEGPVDAYRLALTTCQDFQWGEYGAWRSLADRDDIDGVLFTGDYIYELPPADLSPDQSGNRVWNTPPPTTLEHFRKRYSLTKSDPSLQAAHQAMPWFVQWDDHEITDNYWADGGGQLSVNEPEAGDFVALRAAAYQAWWEHQPVRFDPPSDGRLDIHRSVRVGDLAQLLLLDTRQHADVPPCRDTSTLDAGAGCDERLDPEPTILGSDQEAWLIDAIDEAPARWNVLVSPCMFAGLDISADGAEEPEYYLESWDGYPVARQRVADALRGADASPVVLSGDYHASFVLDVGPAFGDEPLCAEFMTPAISSVPFTEDHTARNSHVRYFDPVNGYVVCTITPESCRADYHTVEDVWDPESPVTAVASFEVGYGDTAAAPALTDR